MKSVCTEIGSDLVSSKLLPALAQGLVIGVLVVVVEVSFASLIFSGELAEYAMRGCGLTIFGGMAFNVVGAFGSSFKGMVALPQDTPVAILAGVSAAIVGAMAAAMPDARFATVTAAMILSALITAAAFALVGRFSLSNLMKYLPYPVVGGFLSGSGVLLSQGGISVMTGISPGFDTIGQLASWEHLQFWLPGVGYALVVFVWLKLRPHFMVLPGSLALAMAAFYALVMAQGVSVDQLRAGGWLLGGLPEQGLWPAFGMDDVAQVDWGTLLGQVPDLLTIALLALVGMLLNTSGVELGAREDLDMDSELMAGAVANAACVGGGFAGYNTLSLSLLGPKTGVKTRLIPLFTALVCAGVLFLGGQALTFFPKALLGGLIFLLGLLFLDEWVFTGWKRLAPVDYGIVLVISAAIAQFGFLEGVGLGLLLAVFFFLFRFSRVPVIEREFTGAEAASSRHRSVPDRILLRSRGGDARVFRVQGFVFFGSASSLSDRVGGALAGDGEPPRYIVVDLTGIDGYDISAVNTFQRMAQQAQSKDAMLLLAGAPDGLYSLLERNAASDAMEHVRRFAGLDEAMEWLEDGILAEEHAALADGGGEDRRDALFSMAADDMAAHLEAMERFENLVERLDPYLERRELADGETLCRTGEDPGGAYLVLFGTAALVDGEGDGARRVRSLGQGGVVSPMAALGPCLCEVSVRAEGRCVAGFLSAASLERLEREDPAAAIDYHRLAATALGCGCDQG